MCDYEHLYKFIIFMLYTVLGKASNWSQKGGYQEKEIQVSTYILLTLAYILYISTIVLNVSHLWLDSYKYLLEILMVSNGLMSEVPSVSGLSLLSLLMEERRTIE